MDQGRVERSGEKRKEGRTMGTGMRRICGAAAVLVLVCAAIHLVCDIAERPVPAGRVMTGETDVERTETREAEIALPKSENVKSDANIVRENAEIETREAAPHRADEPPVPSDLVGKKAVSMSEAKGNDRYAGLPVLQEREVPSDANGESHRVRVVRTDGKYPLVRVDETRAVDPVTHEEKVTETVEMAADHIVVTLKEGATEDDLRDLNAKLGARVLKKLRVPGSGTYLVKLPAAEAPVAGAAAPVDDLVDAVPRAADEYAKAEDLVSCAEPDYMVRIVETIPNDPGLGQCWGLHNTGQTGGIPDADIDAPEAWDRTTGDANVLVGIIDTGIDYNHPDLAPNIWNNPGETGTDSQGADMRTNGVDDDGNGYVDDWRGWDFLDETNDPMDDHFHGTHCAGTIGAAGNNDVGVAGVNWTVSLVALKFLSAQGSGWLSDAVEAISYGTTIGVDLTSNSWGGGPFTQAMQDAIADADSHGILFVAAAGNSGVDADAIPMYPAAYDNPNIISVAASDHRDTYASFSNHGATTVDLAAPGVSIYSTFPTYWTEAMQAYKDAGRDITTDYCSISGTSMATPHVAGVCALAKAYRPSLTGTQIKKQVLLGTDPLPKDLMNRSTQTNGRLNAYAMLRTLDGPYPRPVDVEDADGTEGGANGNGDGYINPGERIAVTAPIQNRGVDEASDVTAVLALTTEDEYVTVVRGDASYGDIGPGDTVSASDTFIFDVSADTPTPHDAAFTMTVADSAGGEWQFPLTFTVYNSYEISGIVTLDDQPLSGAQVRCLLLPDYAKTYTATCGADGRYSISVLDGEYGLYAINNFSVGQLFTSSRVLKVPGSDTHDVNFGFTTGTVSGRVVYGPTGAPVAEADVIVKTSGYGPETNQTAADGTFTHSRVFGFPMKTTVYIKKKAVGVSEPAARTMPPDWEQNFALAPYPGPFYKMVPIESSGGLSAAVGYDVNDSAQVAGGPGSMLTNNYNAWLWEDGTLTSLGNISGYDFGWARGINGSRQIVGYLGSFDSIYNYSARAFLWQNGALTALPNPFGGQVSYALGINDAGRFAGYTVDSDGLPIPVLWNSTTDAVRLSSDKYGVANAIDQSGRVAGSFYPDYADTTVYHACLWKDGAMTDLGTLGGDSSSAYGLNDSGQVVGASHNADGKSVGFLWENGSMTELPGYYNPGVSYTYQFIPSAVNDDGTIVGGAFRMKRGGAVIPLDDLVVEGGEGWTISMGSAGTARAISDDGYITGRMQPYGSAADVAYLLVPLEESTNRFPVAADDRAATAMNESAVIPVLANDYDPDGDPLTVTFVTPPENGRVSITGNGSAVLYEPMLGYAGSDSFTYTVGDGRDGSDKAMVTLTVGSQPELAVSPEALDVTAAPGETVTRTLTVSNSGGSPLYWSVSNRGEEAPEGGDLIQYFYAVSGDERMPIAGLTYDGSILWSCKGQMSPILHKLDPVTGDILGMLDVGAVCSMPYDVAWDGARLWLCDSLYGKLHEVDPDTGEAVKSFTMSGYYPAHITFAEGVIWAVAVPRFQDPCVLITIDPDDGSVLSTLPYPEDASQGSAVAWFRGALWLNGTNGTILKVNPRNGEVVGSFPNELGWGVAASDGASGLFTIGSYFGWGGGYTYVGLMETSEIPWLQEEPWGGTVPANSSAAATVTFDAAEAAEGVHTAGIRVDSNDLENQSLVVPVTFTVTSGGGGNTPPVAQDQSVTTAEDTPKATTLSATDANGDALTYAIVSGPSHGSLSGSAPNMTYTPAANYNGADSFTFRANDGAADSNTATVSIAVTPVNDAPTVTALADPMSGEAPLAVQFTASGNDVDGDTLSYSWTFGDGGTSGAQNPAHTYNVAGTYTARVTISDGKGGTASAQVVITVIEPANTPPVAQNQSVTTAEDAAKAIMLVATDADGDALTYAIVSGPANGSLSGTAPNVTYTPDADFNGSDSFTFRADDGEDDSNVATVSISVTPVNDAPTVTASADPMSGEAPLAVQFTAVGSDIDGDALSYAWTFGDGSTGSPMQNPAHTYNEAGTYTAVVTVSDGSLTAFASVTIAVADTPDTDWVEPFEAYEMGTDLHGQGGWKGWDNNSACGALVSGSQKHAGEKSAEIVGPSDLVHEYAGYTTGTWAYTAWQYVPDKFSGRHYFIMLNRYSDGGSKVWAVQVYFDAASGKVHSDNDGAELALVKGRWVKIQAVIDLDADVQKLFYDGTKLYEKSWKSGVSGTGDQAIAAVDLFANGASAVYYDDMSLLPYTEEENTPPVAEDQDVTTEEDTAVDISLVATDADGDALTYSIVASPLHGTLSGTVPNVTYTPGADYNGADSFTFKANDGQADSNVATVSITVLGLNDSPVAVASANPTSGNAPLTVAFDGSASYDVDGTIVDYEWDLDESSDYGPQIAYTYTTPGTYTVTLYVFDNQGASGSVSLTITVTEHVNAPPVAQNQAVVMDEDTTKAITLAATDAEGDVLTYSIVSEPGYGMLTGTAPNVTYVPDEDFYGEDSFTFRANDGQADSNVATVSITVNPVNDAPVARGGEALTSAGEAVDITLRAYDVDEDAITYAIAEAPANGTISGDDGDATITYTPKDGFAGVDTFTFVANDGALDSVPATITVTVQGELVTIVSVSTGRAYSLATAEAGALYYIDRKYTILDLSAELDGAVLVRTSNNDKYVTEPNHLTLRIGREAIVSVCYDKRWAVLPGWLDDGSWEYAGSNMVVTDKGASPMDVFEKTVQAGEITLGGNRAGGAAGSKSMYVVVVRPTAATVAKVGAAGAYSVLMGPLAATEWLNEGDADGDGLTDIFEQVVGLDPQDADTSGDGTYDEYEAGPDGRDWFDLMLGQDMGTGRNPVPDPDEGGGGSGGGCFLNTAR